VSHSVVNFAQYESFGYVPAAPSCLLSPPPGWNKTPVKKGNVTMDDIFKALPTKNISVQQVAIVKFLSTYEESYERLGLYNHYQFTEEAAMKARTTFQNDLQLIGEEIEKRGWDHMHPRLLPLSVAV